MNNTVPCCQVLSLRWGLLFLVVITQSLGLTAALYAAPLARLSLTPADVHAIVNSISVGDKPTFGGEKGEFPVRRAVYIANPEQTMLDPSTDSDRLYIMMNGIVISHE